MAEKILVTGANGQLGFDVIQALKKRNIEFMGVAHSDFSITDRKAVLECVNSYKPTAVIHCAAFTAVDIAEVEKEQCFFVNEIGTKNIAEACADIDAKLMYISTDYVFSGNGTHYYKVDDIKKPQNVYGASKLAGEIQVQEIMKRYFIVRISWAFGENGDNFVKSMIKLGKSQSVVRVVNDQIGSPTYTKDVAELLIDIVCSNKYGVYHATNESVCSRYELVRQIFKILKLKTKVIPVSTDSFITKAKRPLNSRLDKSSLVNSGFYRLPPWIDALARFLEDK